MTAPNTPSTAPAGVPVGNRAAWIVGLTIIVVLAVIYFYRAVFGPLLLALAFAYILEPVVQKLTGRGWRRGVAVGVVFGALLMLFLVTFAWLTVEGVLLVNELSKGIQEVQAGSEGQGRILKGWQEFGLAVERQGRAWLGADNFAMLKTQFEGFDWERVLQPVLSVLASMAQAVFSALSSFSVLILLPLYLCYLMLDLERIWAWLLRYIPSHNREKTLRVLDETHMGMSAFLRGRVVVAVLKGLLTFVGLLLCGTPMSLAVGLGSGILSIVPFIGPFVGFAVAMALTLAETQAALAPALGVIAVYSVAEFVEGFVLTPWVMGKDTEMSSLTIVFSVIFWGAALGLFGALVAIPLTLVLKILFREYVLPSVEELAEPDAPDSG